MVEGVVVGLDMEGADRNDVELLKKLVAFEVMVIEEESQSGGSFGPSSSSSDKGARVHAGPSLERVLLTVTDVVIVLW